MAIKDRFPFGRRRDIALDEKKNIDIELPSYEVEIDPNLKDASKKENKIPANKDIPMPDGYKRMRVARDKGFDPTTEGSHHSDKNGVIVEPNPYEWQKDKVRDKDIELPNDTVIEPNPYGWNKEAEVDSKAEIKTTKQGLAQTADFERYIRGVSRIQYENQEGKVNDAEYEHSLEKTKADFRLRYPEEDLDGVIDSLEEYSIVSHLYDKGCENLREARNKNNANMEASARDFMSKVGAEMDASRDQFREKYPHLDFYRLTTVVRGEKYLYPLAQKYADEIDYRDYVRMRATYLMNKQTDADYMNGDRFIMDNDEQWKENRKKVQFDRMCCDFMEDDYSNRYGVKPYLLMGLTTPASEVPAINDSGVEFDGPDL